MEGKAKSLIKELLESGWDLLFSSFCFESQRSASLALIVYRTFKQSLKLRLSSNYLIVSVPFIKALCPGKVHS